MVIQAELLRRRYGRMWRGAVYRWRFGQLASPDMCSSCVNQPSGSFRDMPRSARWQWSVLAAVIMVLVTAVIVTRSPAHSQRPGNRSDEVFALDSARQQASGVALAQTIRTARSAELRRFGTVFLRAERNHVGASLGRAAGALGPTTRDTVVLGRITRHAQDDALTARIELESGKNPGMRAAARRLDRSSASMLRAVGELAPRA